MPDPTLAERALAAVLAVARDEIGHRWEGHDPNVGPCEISSATPRWPVRRPRDDDCPACVIEGLVAAPPREIPTSPRRALAAIVTPRRRRWAVAVAVMSLVSIVNIVLAAIVDPLMARMFCASAAWAAGAVTMFCLAEGLGERHDG